MRLINTATPLGEIVHPAVLPFWQVFNASLVAESNGRRTRNHHHPPQPRHQKGVNSAHFPPPTDAPSQAPPLAALSSMPLRSASLPAPQQRGQQHGRDTDAVVRASENNGRCRGSSGRVKAINRAAARQQGAVMYQNGAGGSDSTDGGGFSRSPMAAAAARTGGGGGRAGLRKETGDAVDDELLNKSLDAVRHRVKHYRMHIKPSFQVNAAKGGLTQTVELNVRRTKVIQNRCKLSPQTPPHRAR